VENEPLSGLRDAISPSMNMTSVTMTPPIRYDRIAAGPAVAIMEPEPTNRPAPMTPPSAIIVMCRCLRLFFNE
jgi:hypothetical protein